MSVPSLSDLPAAPDDRHGWPWTEASEPLPETRADGSPWPRLSVVTPSYNQGAFVEETIRSVLLQGYPNLEYVVIDGGSTDETLDVLRRYEPWVDVCVSEPDRGQSDAINKGMAMVDGRMTTWLNSDDVFYDRALQTVGEYVADHPDCRFLTGDGIFSDSTATTQLHYQNSGSYTAADLLDYSGGRFLPQPSVWFDPDLYDDVGGLDDDLHYAMDMDLWIRLREQASLHYVDAPLSILRQHERAKTLRDNDAALQEVGHVMRRHSGIASPLHYLLVRLRLRRQRARSACQRALRYVCNGNNRAALYQLSRSLGLDCTILFTRDWHRVALRLFLPRVVQTYLLHNPVSA